MENIKEYNIFDLIKEHNQEILGDINRHFFNENDYTTDPLIKIEPEDFKNSVISYPK